MSTEMPRVAKGFRERLLLPILLLSVFLIYSVRAFASTLQVDIASSLKISIGTTGQIGTVTNFTGLIMGFVMGALSIKFRHKTLFLIGVAFYGVGMLGFSLAQNISTRCWFKFPLGWALPLPPLWFTP